MVYGIVVEQKGFCDLKLMFKGKVVYSLIFECGYNVLVLLIKLFNEVNDYFEMILVGEMGLVRFNIDVLNGGD